MSQVSSVELDVGAVALGGLGVELVELEPLGGCEPEVLVEEDGRISQRRQRARIDGVKQGNRRPWYGRGPRGHCRKDSQNKSSRHESGQGARIDNVVGLDGAKHERKDNARMDGQSA